MCMLSHRLQVLIAPEQFRRLEQHARERGISVGAVVRASIERTIDSTPARRLEALERILAAPSVALPADPADLERELDAMLDSP
jgi:hypothetical protein